ncbi:MAG: hypothetical protein ACK5O8_11885 [Pirellula sp.]
MPGSSAQLPLAHTRGSDLASRSETRQTVVRNANPSEPSALAPGGDTLRIASSDVLIQASAGAYRVPTPSCHLLTREALIWRREAKRVGFSFAKRTHQSP